MLLALVLALGGCGLGGDEAERPGGDRGKSERQRDGSPGAATRDERAHRSEPPEGRPIRAWIAALNSGDFDRAASFFATDALVEQPPRTVRLEDREAAIEFNRSLPCRAEVTDVEDEGETVLAAFRLRGGRAGGCDGGSAGVRFRFQGGKFAEWRQLAEPSAPEGKIARAGRSLRRSASTTPPSRGPRHPPRRALREPSRGAPSNA